MDYPVINKEKTGSRLKALLRIKGYSATDIQVYLSLACPQTVYRWFSGINIPSIDHLYALSELLQMSLDDLIVGNRRYGKNPFHMKFQNRILLYFEYFMKAQAH